jgi:type I restriction enzyme S subunit
MDADLFLQQFGHLAQGEGGIKKLRDVLLQLAVQGKLVAQNPADENASVILQKIKAEQKSKKNQASLATNDSELYPLPAKWVWTRLGHIAAYGVPQKVNGNDEITPDTWVLDLEDIEKDTSRLLQRVYAQERTFQSAKTVFQKGDVLFGKLRPYLNKVLVADDAGVCTTEIVPIRAQAAVNPNYIRLVLQSPMTMRAIERLMYGMKMPRLGTSDANNLSFPLPPLAEQKRIVAKVDELMALCDKLEAEQKAQRTLKTQAVQSTLHHLTSAESPTSFGTSLNILERTFGNWFDDLATVKHLRATILQLAVQGKLVPQNPTDEPAVQLFKKIKLELQQEHANAAKKADSLPLIDQKEVPFSLPSNWCWYRLQSIVSRLGDGLHGTPEYSNETDCYFINGNNLADGKIIVKPNTKTVSIRDAQKHLKLMTDNTVLVSINGTLGNVAFYNNENVLLGKSACYFNLSKYVDKHFARLVIESPYFLNYAQENATGSTIRNLGLRAMNYFPFPLPPIAEQKRIVAKVDELMTLCDKLEAHITQTQTLNTYLMDSLIHRMTATA